MLNVVDLFCGGGGTSTGAMNAAARLGMKVQLCAVNHWEIAIETHARNHPGAKHLCKAIDQIRPREAVRGAVDLLLASPECTHHSIARGGKPINDQSRMSAWEVIRWAAELLPRRIIVENVREFQTWGPIGAQGQPLKSRKGETFAAWCQALRSLGYRLETRELNAANFGGATTRERLFVQAVRGRAPILWPAPSHAQCAGEATLFDSGMKPWKPAREIIDWSLPSQSIFTRPKPLAPATLDRIAAGLRKFGGKAAEPFLVILRHNGWANSANAPLPTITAGGNHFGLVEPFIVPQFQSARPRTTEEPLSTLTTTSRGVGLVQPFLVPFFGERPGQAPRTHSVSTPMPTVTGQGAGALVQPFILPLNHGRLDFRSHSMERPMPGITTVDAWGMIEPLIVEYYGTGDAESVASPLRTVTTKDRFGLAEFAGGAYLDIRFRMLQPHELAAAMGFPAGYYFHGNREQKVKQIGNAVQVDQAEALCLAAIA